MSRQFDPDVNRPQVSGPLFEAVQKNHVFPDSKTFVDCTPAKDPNRILEDWQENKNNPGFDLSEFVKASFQIPGESGASDDQTEAADKTSRPAAVMHKTCREHIRDLWPHLFRDSDDDVPQASSLIPLPYPYVVPGGRFREIYYWDSYFTARGLAADGHKDKVLEMTRNFAFLIESAGHIPNGNRVYYLSRSQPPFFTPMVELVRELFGDDQALTFLPAVEKEYAFWMDQTGESGRRCISLGDGRKMNRYWDDNPLPREESWREDVEAAMDIPVAQRQDFYRNIRAACESGWDFSSRWFADLKSLRTIRTTELLPVDLNTLMWFMELKLSEWYALKGNHEKAEVFQKKCNDRASAVQSLMWDESNGFFFDFDLQSKIRSDVWSLAGLYPLYFGLATPDQAHKTARRLEKHFLRPGGLVTTLNDTGQQWDSPNGWAPLHWIAVKGLLRYQENEPARTITQRWLNLNKKVYDNSGKMVEKYNVVDITREGGGGEYPLQDGFGWSNGVFSALDDLVESMGD